MGYDGILVNSNNYHPLLLDSTLWFAEDFSPPTGTPSKCGSEKRRGRWDGSAGRIGNHWSCFLAKIRDSFRWFYWVKHWKVLFHPFSELRIQIGLTIWTGRHEKGILNEASPSGLQEANEEGVVRSKDKKDQPGESGRTAWSQRKFGTLKSPDFSKMEWLHFSDHFHHPHGATRHRTHRRSCWEKRRRPSHRSRGGGQKVTWGWCRWHWRSEPHSCGNIPMSGWYMYI